MRTLLIKTGKAINALKQEGLVRGGKRVAKSFAAQFGRVRPGDILFVTVGVGDSARYRAHNQAEELRLHGFQCSVTIQDNPFLPKYADKFKIFIFHRPVPSTRVTKLFESAKKLGKEIIFETDDLVYDPEYIRQMDFFQKLNLLEKKQFETGVGSEILNDEYVKTCVVATSFLADKLKKYGKKVFISKNKLSNYDVEVAQRVVEIRSPHGDRISEAVKIGYFSGTASHDKDFETVKRVLVGILEKYPDVELNLFGPLEIDDVYAKFGERVKKHPFSPWEKHLKNIADVDVNIAPLEIGNSFCESKSELKFIEAGIMGVPTIATATQTFRDAIRDGVDGFVAGDNEEWKEKLEKLISDKDLRSSMGQKAREKVLQKYTNKNSDNEEYYNYLRSKL